MAVQSGSLSLTGLQARHTKGKQLALSASPAASAVAPASSASVGGANLTVDAAIVAATAAGNGTTDPLMSMTKEVLGEQFPDSVKTALLGFPAGAQEDIAASLLTLGPQMEAIVPIVHARILARQSAYVFVHRGLLGCHCEIDVRRLTCEPSRTPRARYAAAWAIHDAYIPEVTSAKDTEGNAYTESPLGNYSAREFSKEKKMNDEAKPKVNQKSWAHGNGIQRARLKGLDGWKGEPKRRNPSEMKILIIVLACTIGRAVPQRDGLCHLQKILSDNNRASAQRAGRAIASVWGQVADRNAESAGAEVWVKTSMGAMKICKGSSEVAGAKNMPTRLNSSEKGTRCQKRLEFKRISQEHGFGLLGGGWSLTTGVTA
ncbi:hypothetical protein B0H17DRAFT_1238123 [Mycena rosella]|uniref:Uncharacterized protein n=1 Tax=Mycena rosella TaxID=1033263 RepID=A0AAD7D305_MYCRO|nr:hypothetical protein B0H17DRAFT_1238123 [Mycena rosella]